MIFIFIVFFSLQENSKNITRIIASENYHDISPSASIPSSPELETHLDLVSPKLDSEMDFIDPDTNLQNHSMPIQDIFEEDSSINIYKKITGEVLRIIFKGILKCKNIIKKILLFFLLQSQDLRMFWYIVLKNRDVI